MNRYLGIIIILACFLSSLKAQKGVELGGHIGLSHYYGDLNPDYSLSDPGLSFGLKARRNFNYRVCVAMGLDYGRIGGSDENAVNAFERSRNLSFKSNVYDLNFTMEFNFFPYVHGSSDFYYTPYLFGGFSMFRFNPKAELDGETYTLRDYNTEGNFGSGQYFLMAGSVVYGMGLKYDINTDFSINIQLSGRRIFNDYIDDVSGSYPNYNQLANATAVALSNRSEDNGHGIPNTQRGDGRSNDAIYYLQIGIMRYFTEIRCPDITKDIFN